MPSPLDDLLSEIETSTPSDFQSYLSIKQKIETRLSELKDQYDGNSDLITKAEKQLQTSFVKLKINFIERMLADVQMSDLLFGDLHTLNEEKVKKTFIKLSLEFHPDKCSDINRPELTKIFYQGILNIKEHIIDILSNPTQNESKKPMSQSFSSKSCVYPDEKLYKEEIDALKAWEIAIDYQNALKENCKLKHLKLEDIVDLSKDRLIKLRKEYAMKAYAQYAKACNHADREQNIYKCIALRRSMAMSLYLADDIYHAQLYALGTLHLLLDKSMTFANLFRDGKTLLPYAFTLSMLDELLIFLKKISNKSTTLKTQDNPIINSRTHTFMVDNKHKQCLDILSELQNLAEIDLMSFFPDVSFIFTEHECRSALIPTEEKPVTASKSLMSSLYSLLMQSTTDQKKARDPDVSIQIQTIIRDALQFFYRGEYHNFLLAISHGITAKDSRQKPRLFWYGEHCHNPKDVVNLMLEHGYQPYGIGCLIILISNAVFHLEKGYKSTTVDDLKYASSVMLNQILFNDELKMINDMQEKMVLLKKIATIRLTMYRAIKCDPFNEQQAVLSYFTSLMDEQEKLPAAHQQWYNRVMVLMQHMVTSLGMSQEDSSLNLTKKDAATPRSFLSRLSIVGSPKLTVTPQENTATTVTKSHCMTP